MRMCRSAGCVCTVLYVCVLVTTLERGLLAALHRNLAALHADMPQLWSALSRAHLADHLSHHLATIDRDAKQASGGGGGGGGDEDTAGAGASAASGPLQAPRSQSLRPPPS